MLLAPWEEFSLNCLLCVALFSYLIIYFTSLPQTVYLLPLQYQVTGTELTDLCYALEVILGNIGSP